MLDPISDMLTRIRNAQTAGRSVVRVPSSKVKFAVAKILKEEGFVSAVELMKTDKKFDFMEISLKYDFDKDTNLKVPVISGIQRISKEGQRIYVKKGEIRRVKNGMGVSIISTSKGVVSGEKARKDGLGGELICEVW
ncbi:MAG: 30S ribosomal protein S8 [Candidatus Moranbacteria bacterium GW2011_GWE2_35_2-]|nr:MAG: 30S ribosomal protein S8 [Candidatus Moranbacteria bacterium GW2011_GWE2_35_2-]KKQ04913.1 MAG: 30S ribosomal protein S8 [Candidatus Moranbacteria bacterium GW2011_GWF1_36_4]KKQ22917.1 MAG: 30S ribosomal protein S8 [Candidatus Moranbacteria bacterium GW2011_GWF2_37_11]KKQ29275.1 MAG: 30S ribosomal protein S8 [Candidatus Moranbacteria bacterium GW2011_GWD1_37_17]KKQ30852.1 MAG: 30S ribosomal protein S8 [Candidatus Moranbacteria bacterium GW2011_GWE1_37_24]KKQ47289.1 MAG: 30S ribosomal pr